MEQHKTHQQIAKEKSIEPVKAILEKKVRSRESLKDFIERNKGQKIGVQINFFAYPEHVCIGLSHPADVECMTTKVLDTLDGQIKYFQDAIDKLTK